MTNPRAFHIGDVLSITTGRLVSPRGIEAIYDILNYLTGDDLYTHQLPRASRECAPVILAQHPRLADVDASQVNTTNWREWLGEQVQKFGETLPLTPIPQGGYAPTDPLLELASMTDKPIIVVAQTTDGHDR